MRLPYCLRKITHFPSRNLDKGMRNYTKKTPDAMHCKQCGKEFSTEGRRGKVSYCSEDCSNNATIDRRREKRRDDVKPFACELCGKNVEPRQGARRFCSEDCRSKSRNTAGRTCLVCGKPGPYTCSDECSNKYKSRAKARDLFKAMQYRTTDTNARNRAYRKIEVRMTKDEFMTWAVPLVEAFYSENPDQTPSVDRIDPDGHYEMSNMRIISWNENNLRSRFFLRLFGVSKDRTKEENLTKLLTAAMVIGGEVGLTKEHIREYLTA